MFGARNGTCEPTVAHFMLYYNLISAGATFRIAEQHEAGSSKQLVLKKAHSHKDYALSLVRETGLANLYLRALFGGIIQ